MRPSLIYVASPYTHKNFYMRQVNVIRTAKYIEYCYNNNVLAHNPVMQLLGTQITLSGTLKDVYRSDLKTCATYNRYSFAMLWNSDQVQVLMLPNWEKSKDVIEEIELAKRLGLPIKYVELVQEIPSDLSLKKHVNSNKIDAPVNYILHDNWGKSYSFHD